MVWRFVVCDPSSYSVLRQGLSCFVLGIVVSILTLLFFVSVFGVVDSSNNTPILRFCVLFIGLCVV